MAPHETVAVSRGAICHPGDSCPPKAITKIELTKTTETETAVTSILRYLLLYPGQG